MLRRLTVLLVMWIGLIGAASPAFACAMDALAGDCCPPDATLPCGDMGSSDRSEVAAAICCASASLPARAVSIDSARSLHEQLNHAGSSGVVIVPFWAAAAPAVHLTYVLAPALSPPVTDGALTYLYTGRLRL